MNASNLKERPLYVIFLINFLSEDTTVLKDDDISMNLEK